MNMVLGKVGAVLVALFATLAMANAAQGQCGGRWLGAPGQFPSGLNGTVYALAILPSGELLAGGSFTSTWAGVPMKALARWDGASWRPLGTGVSAAPLTWETFVSVNALAVLPNGHVVAGGTFTTAGGEVVNNIAKWDGQRWSALGSGVSGVRAGPSTRVNALAVMPNGDLIAAGDFSSAGGFATNSIARWDGTRWWPMGSGLGGISPTVNCLLTLTNGDLVVGGSFSTAGGVTANRIARWNGTAWSGFGSGLNGRVTALAVLANGDLVAGGTMTGVGRLARWTGSAWVSVGGGVSGTAAAAEVLSIAVLPNGDLAVSGKDLAVGGARLGNLAVWNGGSWLDLGRDGQIGWAHSMIVLENGDLVVSAGGEFDRQFAGAVLRWNGSTWLCFGDWNPPAVESMIVTPSGDVLTLGGFRAADLQSISGIGRWDGSAWVGIAAGVGRGFARLAVLPNGQLVGAWSEEVPVGGRRVLRAAKWDGLSWTRLGGDFEYPFDLGASLSDLVVLPNADVVLAGRFTSVGGAAVNHIARWDGSQWTGFGLGVADEVHRVVVRPNGDLVAEGTLRPLCSNCLILWDGQSWSRISAAFRGGIISSMCALTDGRLVVGGRRQLFNLESSWVLVVWDGVTWTGLPSPLLRDVTALLATPDGGFYAAGPAVSTINPGPDRVAHFNGTAWTALGDSFEPGENNMIRALTLAPSGELFVGGWFSSVGGLPARGFARWTDTGGPRVSGQPTADFDPATRTLTLSASCAAGYEFDGPIRYQWRRQGRAVVDGPDAGWAGGSLVSGSSGAVPSVINGMRAVMRIRFAGPVDVGSYDVVFTNGCGSVTSASVIVRMPACSIADVVSVGGQAPADGLLTGDDYLAFINAFSAGDMLADVCGIGGGPGCAPDGLVTSDDFNAFIGAFAAGCP